MALIAIGDIQFSDDRPWSFDVAKRVVDHLLNHPTNNKRNTAVFLGDITENAFISGQVIALLERFFHDLKYEKVYVLQGNHELKKNKVGQETYVLDFLRSSSYPNIEIVDSVREITLNGAQYLMLPFFHPTGTRTMKAEYEALHFDHEFAAVFGHLQDNSLNLPGESIDLSHIKTRHWCLGHIHNPSDHYLGSVVPNAVSEAHKVRRIMSFEGAEVEIILLRTILEYYDVMYPEPLPTIDCDVPVFTVYNCADEAVAREKYGNIYIRKCIYEVTMDFEAFKQLGEKMQSLGSMSAKELFIDFVRTAKFDPPEIGVLAEKYLTATN